MIINYLKIVFRNIRKYKMFSMINVLGLGIGISISILVMLWVQHEMSFDRFHENGDRIYRVVTRQVSDGHSSLSAETQYPLGPELENDYPEVVDSVRLYTKWDNMFMRRKEKSFVEDRVLFSDPSFLTVFSFPLKRGDRSTALAEKHAIVLTEEMAVRYFGDEDPMGKMIGIDFFNRLTNFRVTGILKKVPSNSHLQFDCLIPFQNFDYSSVHDLWKTPDNYQTYILASPNTSGKQLEEKIGSFKADHVTGSRDRLELQPLNRIHLFSNAKFDSPARGDIRFVYMFSMIGFFALIIAAVNFMNLSTARSEIRSREIGLRKVIGASRKQLIRQFLGESVVLSILAMILALFLVSMILPVFNGISGKNLVMADGLTVQSVLILGGITVLTGILSGGYPAFYLSSISPWMVLKRSFGGLSNWMKGISFRRLLVLVQFTLAIVLIASTWFVFKQLTFIQNKDLGFDRENVIYIPARGNLQEKYLPLKNELLKNENITGVSGANILPTHLNENPLDSWTGNPGSSQIMVNITSVGFDYFDTMGMNIEQGRDFSRDMASDMTSSCIINQEAARQMGMTDPVGKQVSGRTIVGVVRDYHFTSLHRPIEPMILTMTDRYLNNIFIRMKAHVPESIEFIRKTYERFIHTYSFEYHFLDRDIAGFYANEKRTFLLFISFTVLTIFIACMGLYGLASFMAERRIREIGIRKSVGASVPGIASMLIGEFSRWVVLAALLAWPVISFVMNRWLQNFAYRISLDWEIFLFSGLLALMIAVLTTGYHSVIAACTNPVDALRYE